MTLRHLALNILLLGSIASVYGGLIAPQSIVYLQQNADLIIVGSATGSVQSGTVVDMSIQITRVVKGDTDLTGRAIAARWVNGHLDAGGSGTSVGNHHTGIWFLRRAVDAWQVLPVVQGAIEIDGLYFPSLSGPILPSYAYKVTDSVADKVASEIAAAIEQQSAYSFQLYALQAGLLDESKTRVWDQMYQRMSKSPVSTQRILGFSGLIRTGNASVLAAVAPIASSLRDSPAHDILLRSIRDVLRSTDPNSVAAIGRAATDVSQSTALREAAAHALAAIHTRAALPFLATLLDDPNQNLRIEAIGGMAAFANGLAVQTNAGVPSLTHLQIPDQAPYKTADTVAHLAIGHQAIAANEVFYLEFWKTWWSQQRTSLGY